MTNPSTPGANDVLLEVKHVSQTYRLPREQLWK